MAQTLYLIDGHAQIYRAYFAPFATLRAPSGEPTRATHVFWQMVLNILKNRRPQFMAMALDVSDETVFRRDIHAEYKAHREPPPEDLPIQRDRIIGMAEALGLPILRAPGFEADDIMATLAARLAGPELHVVLVSKDKDLEQLLGPHVSMYDPGKDALITPDVLLREKGWRPEQAVEAQILTGDSVDNVPGVPGIGPKTAAKLLEKYGTALGVIEHAHELSPKQRENVLAFAPSIETARSLVTLRKDTPVDFDLDAARVERLRWSAVVPIMRKLGMRRMLEQVPAEEGGGAEEQGRGSDRGADRNRSSERRHEPPPVPTLAQLRAPALEQPEGGRYHLVGTAEELAQLVDALRAQPAFAIDTETSGTHPLDADLLGVSLAWRPGEAYYLPVQSIFGPTLSLEQLRSALGPLLADGSKLKVGHHVKYDAIVLHQAGMPVAGPLFDTMIAAFVLDPLQTSFRLDSLAARVLNHTMIPITDLIGKGRDQLRLDQVPLAHVAEYSGEDADYTWRLHALFEPHLRGSELASLFYDVEMPLVRVLMDMERHGVRVDVEFLQRMSRQLAARIGQITDEIHRLAGVVFNIDSPKQLAEVLFDRLGMRVVRRTATTRSTDADTLETLADETGHPVLRLLLEHRELQKLRGTYVDALPREVSKRTGRVHTSYHQTGAVTGRLSSSEPNLQNIPVRTDLGREIRRAFIPSDPGQRLIVADYSQVELRILAHFSGDEQLRRAFADDEDIHQFVAAQVNGVPPEQVTREMRGRAKAVNFGIVYGQTAFGLAQGTGMSRNEAQQFIDNYFRRYPRIRGFIDQCIAQAAEHGFVRTILGRRRPIPDIQSRNRAARALAERLAVNTVVQGSAADLIKVAMVQLHRRIERDRLPLRMLLQVHDELVCEAPSAEAEAMARVVAEVMGGAMEMSVPLKVETHVGENWLEAK
ncbi:MAG: DNA polymerase I [Phycisphaerae bacterium]|jgi:DNA polymerase-1|nr:DNA polymerase I [Phycisphaerae bacterium]MCZ2398265.1 DNA polymerase I [Phycisphaerae bacterium]NUQ48825.1 DNA polymerase I [Phycisphaerae bacterium]